MFMCTQRETLVYSVIYLFADHPWKCMFVLKSSEEPTVGEYATSPIKT